MSVLADIVLGIVDRLAAASADPVRRAEVLRSSAAAARAKAEELHGEAGLLGLGAGRAQAAGDRKRAKRLKRMSTGARTRARRKAARAERFDARAEALDPSSSG